MVSPGDEGSLAHPFFDALTFPWQRSEATAFFRALSDAVPDRRRIELLYQQAGGELSALNVNGSPAIVWFGALERLTSMGRLHEFCRLLRQQADLAATYPAIDAIEAAKAPTPVGPGRRVIARAPARWNDGLAALNVLLAVLYPTIDDSRRIVATSGIPTAFVKFHGAAAINWFNILELALAQDRVETLVRAAVDDMPNVVQLSELARRNWPGALVAKE